MHIGVLVDDRSHIYAWAQNSYYLIINAVTITLFYICKRLIHSVFTKSFDMFTFPYLINLLI